MEDAVSMHVAERAAQLTQPAQDERLSDRLRTLSMLLHQRREGPALGVLPIHARNRTPVL